MFLNSSLSLAQNSGFVAFDAAGTSEVEVRRKPAPTPAAVVAPQFEPEIYRTAEPATAIAHEWVGSPTWQPPTSQWVRRVEAVMVLALSGYFVLGLAGVAGWL